MTVWLMAKECGAYFAKIVNFPEEGGVNMVESAPTAYKLSAYAVRNHGTLSRNVPWRV